ncbi:LPXTG cell wall anchor domain-containing protein [Streptomyces katrae]|uniref:LPXTG cell wall anchor domain-containing protein n=1 Tax=Streptomyces katrae TaxID=68223 RepID=A0ABT7GUT4_9ACTN|nr:LPXTG cell wall anchor domain-containing protein [Streptomyces katrae]MDK9497380.1 LPXTG cell wall anchor domain-containing protein [Streptomyces katrae]
MSARRPLLTALGATTLLAALWFVPSANATAPGTSAGPSGAPAAANTGTVSDTAADDEDDGDGGDASETGTGTIADASDERPAGITVLSLADTGSIDTTPYVLGGTLCLGLGAGFVTFSVRRSRSL